MKLLELYLKNFGRFRNRKIELSDGLNLITGENESGKSTLHMFIKSMLFGLKKQRGRASRNDDYSRYEPWEEPSYYAGTVRLESGGKLFRLSRNFSRNQASEELICETDGECLSVEDGDLEMLLGGISAGIYDNTVSVRQLKSATDEGLASELKNYMANCQGSADAALDLQAAAAHLKEKRRELENRLRGRRDAKEAEKRKLYGQVEYVRQECRTLEENLETAEEKLRRERSCREMPERAAAGSPAAVGENFRSRRKRTAGIAAAAVILVLLGILWILRAPLPFIGAGFAAAVLALLTPAVSETVRRRKSVNAEGTDDMAGRIQKLQWNAEYLRQEVQAKRTAAENLEQEYREYCLACAEKDPLETDLDGIRLALDTLERLSAGMQKRVGAGLKQRTSEILAQITGGKYLSVSLDEKLNMGLHTKDHYIPLNQASRGTMEQVYFSLRMAAAELLCAEEPLPVLLDEVFAMYDDKRLAGALRWLAGQKRQVLIFTCQNREEKMLKLLRIPYHKTELP